MPPPANFKETCLALREEAGLTRELLVRRIADMEIPGASSGSVNQQIQGTRRPTIVVMEAAAKVLGAKPTVFIEYRLWVARMALDENVVGLRRAAQNLESAPALEVAARKPAIRTAIATAAAASARPRGKPGASRATRRAPGATGEAG